MTVEHIADVFVPAYRIQLKRSEADKNVGREVLARMFVPGALDRHIWAGGKQTEPGTIPSQ